MKRKQISEETRQAIRDLVHSGFTAKQICEKLGVSKSSIWRAKSPLSTTSRAKQALAKTNATARRLLVIVNGKTFAFGDEARAKEFITTAAAQCKKISVFREIDYQINVTLGAL